MRVTSLFEEYYFVIKYFFISGDATSLPLMLILSTVSSTSSSSLLSITQIAKCLPHIRKLFYHFFPGFSCLFYAAFSKCYIACVQEILMILFGFLHLFDIRNCFIKSAISNHVFQKSVQAAIISRMFFSNSLTLIFFYKGMAISFL